MSVRFVGVEMCVLFHVVQVSSCLADILFDLSVVSCLWMLEMMLTLKLLTGGNSN